MLAHQQVAIQREKLTRFLEPVRLPDVHKDRQTPAPSTQGPFKMTWRQTAEEWTEETGLNNFPANHCPNTAACPHGPSLPTSAYTAIFCTWQSGSACNMTHVSAGDPGASATPEHELWTDVSIENTILNGAAGIVVKHPNTQGLQNDTTLPQMQFAHPTG